MIAIKKSHRGLFTKKAKAAGMSVPAYAAKEKNAPGALGKEARFAQTAERHFKPKKGGKKGKGRLRKMAEALA